MKSTPPGYDARIVSQEYKITVKAIVYWTSTAILEFILLSEGSAALSLHPATVAEFRHLGYPLHFVTLLGLWQILGSLTLLTPRFPRLQEWTYAGISFNFVAATVAHIACGSDACSIIRPLAFLLVALLSMLLRPSGGSKSLL